MLRDQQPGGRGSGQGPSRISGPRAEAPHRGGVEAWRSPSGGRHFVSRARHRHGCGGPGAPGRGSDVGRFRAAEGWPIGPSGRRRLQGTNLPEIPGRSPGCGRRRQSDAGATGRDHQDPGQPSRCPLPATRGQGRRRPDQRRRPVRDGDQGGAVLGAEPGRLRRDAGHAGRALSLGSFRRAETPDQLGSGDRRGDGSARVARSWPSPTQAPSPTEVCSASRSPMGAGSESSTRRWSTSRGRETSFCSAAPPGGSHRSATTGSRSCRRRPKARPACRSGMATRWGGR